MQMILNFFSPSILVTLTQVSPTFRVLCNSFLPGCLLTFLLLTLLRLKFLIIGLKQQLTKIDSSSLNTSAVRIDYFSSRLLVDYLSTSRLIVDYFSQLGNYV